MNARSGSLGEDAVFILFLQPLANFHCSIMLEKKMKKKTVIN